jgi:hypothetical protein
VGIYKIVVTKTTSAEQEKIKQNKLTFIKVLIKENQS